MTDSAAPDELVELGIVVKPHGVRGAVKLRLHNPHSEALDALADQLLLQAPGAQPRPAALRVLFAGGQLVTVQLDGVADRDAAEALRGARLLVPRGALPEPDDEEFYVADLVGCVVVDAELGELGTVAQVFEAGASDILVIRDAAAGTERYIPLVDDWVTAVDPRAGRIEVVGADQWDTWSTR